MDDWKTSLSMVSTGIVICVICVRVVADRYFCDLFSVVCSRGVLENYIQFLSALWMREVQVFRMLLG